MKLHDSLKHITAALASLAMVAAQADAKPGNKSKGKGKDKGDNSHSQKDHKGKGPDHGGKGADKDDNHDKKDNNEHQTRFRRFEDTDRIVIVDYFGRYRTQKEGLPPGLAMNSRRGKPLPPGWQKKLVPGYRIDDGEWSRYAPVPSDWFPNLRMEPNTRLYHYGDRVVRVYEPRREVIDVVILPGM